MKNKKQLSIWLINAFIVITLLALAATAYLTFASAEITLPSMRESFTSRATIEVSATGSGDAVLGDVIVREYTKSLTVPVGSSVSQADKAGGTVTISNTTSRSQPLVATTRLLTADGKLFRIQSSVTVPGGGKVSVFAEADQSGDEFLIGPSRFTIPGLAASLQDEIYAESIEAMTYDRFASGVITDKILDAAESSISAEMYESAIAEFTKSLPSGFMLNEESVSVRTVERTVDPKLGESAESVTVTVRASVIALVINETELLTIAREKLQAELPQSQSFIETVPNSLTVTLNKIDAATKSAEVGTELSAWVSTGSLEEKIDRKQLVGKNVSTAKEYLASQGFANAEITLKPGWLPTLPLLADHIKIVNK